MTKTHGLTEANRQEIFAALIGAQDAGADVKDSRLIMATKFGITLEQVRKIEYSTVSDQCSTYLINLQNWVG
jgi:hypothetical protein